MMNTETISLATRLVAAIVRDKQLSAPAATRMWIEVLRAAAGPWELPYATLTFARRLRGTGWTADELAAVLDGIAEGSDEQR
ncbi:MAG TPA: hypothetical protein VH475_01025 [Tepidisphaeraceae bacterium]|jgi:hypothetical protein